MIGLRGGTRSCHLQSTAPETYLRKRYINRGLWIKGLLTITEVIVRPESLRLEMNHVVDSNNKKRIIKRRSLEKTNKTKREETKTIHSTQK